MSNGCKFIRHGTVELGCYLKGNDIIRYVKDTGIGISAKDLPVIFDRFRKIEKVYTNTFRGAGD